MVNFCPIHTNTPKENTMRKIGDVLRVIECDNGWLIRKRVSHLAYARNGNAHNPTAYVMWDVVNPAGRVVCCCPRLAEARQALKEVS